MVSAGAMYGWKALLIIPVAMAIGWTINAIRTRRSRR
ncbi:hypothetical protein Q760_15860 [Cellulomonas cellasea DSM 20118]|uniref:Uncharacterized protein n=1 Tax=Cellulomonas cellasea DSM 20118 TaxID=1408250 RepID=A0A0A0B8C3_9CELL|nr:hypothetical protein Q760_15860 [Cellulomonas cellasea DSM 20118]